MSTDNHIWPDIRSRIADAPTSDVVYSSLSFLGAGGSAEIPGTWFVEALGEIEIQPTTVRQTLFRMVRSGALASNRIGRVNWYSATGATSTIFDAANVLRDRPERHDWDGRWTIVHLCLETNDRKVRDQLRDVLSVHGFGRIRSGVYIHARDMTGTIRAAAKQLGVEERVTLFRGESVGENADADMVLRLWDLPAVSTRYSQFVSSFRPFVEAGSASYSDRAAFALRFAYMSEFFRITWSDPSLPARFLPDDWPADEAWRLVRELRAAVRPKALRFARTVGERVGWSGIYS